MPCISYKAYFAENEAATVAWVTCIFCIVNLESWISLIMRTPCFEPNFRLRRALCSDV